MDGVMRQGIKEETVNFSSFARSVMLIPDGSK
jgi:hypothetical protein